MDPDISTAPFAQKKFVEINGRRMAYIDEGEGDAIIFQHGNPTSSYLWRNVMPHLSGMGRLIACDLIGMGDSAKLDPSGPDAYSYEEHCKYLYALWDKLELGNRVVLVLHDWGSALGFNWAMKYAGRVQGIAYMEGMVKPVAWSDIESLGAADMFRTFRSAAGEPLILEHNAFVEQVLPGSILRKLEPEEMDEYRRPFQNSGEDRRSTLSWPRSIPIDGEPESVFFTIDAYAQFLAGSDIPKLFVNAEPGAFLVGRMREFCRTWPNQTEVTVPGLHFVQEDSPAAIGRAVAEFVSGLRSL